MFISFFFNDTATTEIYTLSLHDALPIFYMSTLQANAEYLGRPHYLMAHNDNKDLFFFSIVVNGRKMILVVRVSVPYTYDEIVNKMREYVGNLRPRYQ